jgi:predicted amidohydrolase
MVTRKVPKDFELRDDYWRSLPGVDLVLDGLGRVRPRVPRHVDVAVGAAAKVAHEVIAEIELPSAELAKSLALELGVGRLAHVSAPLVFIGLRLYDGRE